MNIKLVCMLMPFLGAAWGVGLGAYIRSDNRNAVKKLALWISAIIILLLCIAVMIIAFQ